MTPEPLTICPLCSPPTVAYRNGHHVCTDRECDWCEWCNGKCNMFTASGCNGPLGEAGPNEETTP